MNKRKTAVLLLACGLVIVVLAAGGSYTICSEAYGSGPPYYGRTTNMDKWGDPLRALLIGNALALGISAVLIRAGLRRLGEDRQRSSTRPGLRQ